MDQRGTVTVCHPYLFCARGDDQYDFGERHAERERNIEHAFSLHERRSAQRRWNDHRAWRHLGSQRRRRSCSGTASALGTLTIQGDYFQGPNGGLQVRLAGIGNDRLTVTGQATLGGTLVTLLTSSPLTRQYTVLHTDGGLGGTTFDRVALFNVPPNFFSAFVYDANNVFLNFTAALGVSAALPKNPSNVATSINNFFNSGGTLTPDFGNLFFLTGGNLSNALSQVSGEAATGAQQPAFQLTNQFLGLLLDPLVDGRSGVGGADHPALGFASQREIMPPEVALAYASVFKEPRAPLPSVYEPRWTTWGHGLRRQQPYHRRYRGYRQP